MFAHYVALVILNVQCWLFQFVQYIQQGKIVGSFAYGTKELYSFMDNNPVVCEHVFTHVIYQSLYWVWVLQRNNNNNNNDRLTAFDPGRPVPEGTFTHSHPSGSSCFLYHLVTGFRQPLQMNDFATFDMLPFIPLHFLCTHFWHLVHCNELLPTPLLQTPHGHLAAFCHTI